MEEISIRKIRYVLREHRKGETSNRQIWKTMRIGKRSFYRIIARYQDVKDIYSIKVKTRKERVTGAKPKPVPYDHITKVVDYRLKYKVGAVMLERLLRVKEGIYLPHNTINTILKSAGLTKQVKTRGKKRKWIRWERKHSLSLWQADWSQFENEWLIVIKDDAARVVVGWGKFGNATSENSVLVLKGAVEKYGRPKAMLTGRDAQFYASDKKGKASGKTLFQKTLEANDIKHILARVNHPQTCGKVEREFGEIKKRIFRYKDFTEIEDVIKWHNEIKPHSSLDVDRCETPIEAFERKMHHNRVVIKEFVEV